MAEPMQMSRPVKRAYDKWQRAKDLAICAQVISNKMAGLAKVERNIMLSELAIQINLGSTRLEISGWECKNSPLGICIYNDEDDRKHDECLFCEDPEERK
jgi:hypothetical protein